MPSGYPKSVPIRTLRERFDAYSIPEPNTGCWLWLGPSDRTTHYGYIVHSQVTHLAHRLSWELRRAPIPEGMYVDHTCRVRCCVNPDHLRVVTPRVNAMENNSWYPAVNAAKTHCPKGHSLAGDNLWTYQRDGRPRRGCRTCRLASLRAYYHRRRGRVIS